MSSGSAISAQNTPKKKRLTGVNIGAALCCMPGATLGAIYDGWRAGDEAKEMEAQARQRETTAQERRRTGLGNRNSLTYAVMSDARPDDDRNSAQPSASTASPATMPGHAAAAPATLVTA